MEQGELERISELIIGLSRAELLALHQLVNNKTEFVDYLSESLGAAVSKASATDSFKQAIAPVVASGVLKTARQEPIEMGKAIAPALGPAIRGMIALALDNMSQRVDAHIKTNFSIQGVKWRLEASRTGVPLVDIVMRETLDFRVEHIMLIHQETGTLLQEVSQPDIKTKDPAVVSSMLSAVSDFVVDAFGASNSTDEPQSYKVGDLTAYVEKLGDLAIAAVVRGTLTSSFKQLMRERLETICLVFGEKAHHFDGDVDAFGAAESMIKDCLISVAKKGDEASGQPKKKSSLPLLLIVTLLFLTTSIGLGYQIWQSQLEKTRFENFADTLSAFDGGVLLSASLGEPKVVRMLLDPYAGDPRGLAEQYGYSEEEIDWQFSPYSSLYSGFVDKRIESLIDLPETVSYQFNQGILSFSGEAFSEWIREVPFLAHTITGVEEVDLSGVENLSVAAINAIIEEIESIRIYFKYAEVEPDSEGVQALDLLNEKLIDLDSKTRVAGQGFNVLMNINPLNLSINEDRDIVRSLRRVDFVEDYLNRPISMGKMTVLENGADTGLPYSVLEIKFKE